MMPLLQHGASTIPSDARSVAIAAVVATIVAGVVSAVSTVLAPPLALLFRRAVDRRRSRRLLIDEISDLHRHCSTSLKVLEMIRARPGIPARMHLEKMRIFRTTWIFENTVVSELPVKLRRRFTRLRSLVRNLDFEIDDTVGFLYTRPTPDNDAVADQLLYLHEKFAYTIARLGQELHLLTKTRGEYPDPVRPTRIIYRASEPERLRYLR